MVSVPPFGMASEAFTIKFNSTCSICPGSACTRPSGLPSCTLYSMSSRKSRCSSLPISTINSFRSKIFGCSICLRLNASNCRVNSARRLRKPIRNHVHQHHSRQHHDQPEAHERVVEPPERRQRFFIRFQYDKTQVRLGARQQVERAGIEVFLSESRLLGLVSGLELSRDLLFPHRRERTH